MVCSLVDNAVEGGRNIISLYILNIDYVAHQMHNGVDLYHWCKHPTLAMHLRAAAIDVTVHHLQTACNFAITVTNAPNRPAPDADPDMVPSDTNSPSP